MKTYYITTGLSQASKDIMYVLYSSEANSLKFERILADTLDKAIEKAEEFSKQSNIEIVNNPSALRNRFNSLIFNFGKYKGENVYDVIVKDPAYCEWIRSNRTFEVKDFVTFLIKYRPIDIKMTDEELNDLKIDSEKYNFDFEEAVKETIEERRNCADSIYYTNDMFDSNVVYEAGFEIDVTVEKMELAGDVKFILRDKNLTKYYYSKSFGLLALKVDNNELLRCKGMGKFKIETTDEVIEKFGLQFNSIKIIKK